MKTILIFYSIMVFSIMCWGQDTTAEDEIFSITEVQPEFPGGMAAFYRFIVDSIQYPEYARENRIEGKVFVQFVVDKTGEIVDEQVVKGVHELLDKEALRLIQLSPDWIPARKTKNGEVCRVRMILPIVFKLPSEEQLEKMEKKKARMEKREMKD